MFSVWFRGLADRHDCRRVVQVTQGLFMAVSIGWGVMSVTGTLTIPAACILLVLHGTAGSLWRPAEQVLLQDFVGVEDVPSAVRLNSTFQSLGILLGSVVDSELLLGFGAKAGILVNAAIYLLLTVLLLRNRFTGHTREGFLARQRISAMGAVRSIGTVTRDPAIAGAVIVAGLTSFFIGSALQTVMPSSPTPSVRVRRVPPMASSSSRTDVAVSSAGSSSRPPVGYARTSPRVSSPRSSSPGRSRVSRCPAVSGSRW
ncbi:MAG: MFS transporter [Janthinobacterium lividum]